MKYLSILLIVFSIGCNRNEVSPVPVVSYEDQSPKLVDEGELKENGCVFNGSTDMMTCQFKGNYIERYNQYKAAINYSLSENAIDKTGLNQETRLGLMGRSLAIHNFISFGVVENSDYITAFREHFDDDAFSVEISPIEASYNKMETFLVSLVRIRGGIMVDLTSNPIRAYARGTFARDSLQAQFEKRKTEIIGHLDSSNPEQTAVKAELEGILDAVQAELFEEAQ